MAHRGLLKLPEFQGQSWRRLGVYSFQDTYLHLNPVFNMMLQPSTGFGNSSPEFPLPSPGNDTPVFCQFRERPDPQTLSEGIQKCLHFLNSFQTTLIILVLIPPSPFPELSFAAFENSSGGGKVVINKDDFWLFLLRAQDSQFVAFLGLLSQLLLIHLFLSIENVVIFFPAFSIFSNIS